MEVLSVWLTCQQHFSGAACCTPAHQGAASSLHGSGLLSREQLQSLGLSLMLHPFAESAALKHCFWFFSTCFLQEVIKFVKSPKEAFLKNFSV